MVLTLTKANCYFLHFPELERKGLTPNIMIGVKKGALEDHKDLMYCVGNIPTENILKNGAVEQNLSDYAEMLAKGLLYFADLATEPEWE